MDEKDVKPVDARPVPNVKKAHWESDCPECGRRQTHRHADGKVRCSCGVEYEVKAPGESV